VTYRSRNAIRPLGLKLSVNRCSSKKSLPNKVGMCLTSSNVVLSILVGISAPIKGRSIFSSLPSWSLKYNVGSLIGQSKKRNPASVTVSPCCMVLIDNLEVIISFVDKTVNGLPVSIKASMCPIIPDALIENATKGKYLSRVNFLTEHCTRKLSP